MTRSLLSRFAFFALLVSTSLFGQVTTQIAPPQAQATAPAPVPPDAPYKNSALPVEQRVTDLLSRMTLEEKVAMLAGSGWMESTPIERLGIPAIKMADGPMGVRSWLGSSAITNAANAPAQNRSPPPSPSGVAMAATWDTELVAAGGPGHRAGSESAGPRHDPRPHRQHQPPAALGPQLRGLRRRSLPVRRAWASPTSAACRAKA